MASSTDPIEILSMAQNCSEEPSTLNFFQPLAKLFGAMAQGQDFQEPERGRKPDDAAMLVKSNELAEDHLARAWASAFHLACLTDRLDGFEQALASAGYFCAWAPKAVPKEDLIGFLRAGDDTFDLRMRSFFTLACLYSTGSGVVLPGLGGADVVHRESAVCAELANRLMVDVGMGRKKLDEETHSHYRRAVEIFIESFDPEHIKEALEEVVSTGRHHLQRHPNFFSNLEAVADLLPEVAG